MASIDLPNSPTDGQTFTSGNATYTYIASKGYWDAVTTTAGIQLSSLSVGAAAIAAGDGAIAYDNSTGVFTYTPPVIPAGGIALTDISVGAEATAAGDGAIAYDNTTGVFTYTPPVVGATGIALTDLSVGAEAAASGDGAIAYDNSTGVFTYTPPVIASDLPTQSGKTGAFLTTDGSSSSWDTLVSTTKSLVTSTNFSTKTNPNAYGTHADDVFGSAVATDGTYLAVSATAEDRTTQEGIVYVYNVATGALLHTIQKTTPDDWTNFGQCLSLADGYLAVGMDTGYNSYTGTIEIFNISTGSIVRTLTYATSYYSQWGMKVATKNAKVLVSAARFNTPTINGAGFAQLYDITTGNLIHTFDNPSPVLNDYFGSWVGMTDDYIIISAQYDDTISSNNGVVYVYDATSYELLHTLYSSDTSTGKGFGSFFSINGSLLAVAGTSYVSTNQPVDIFNLATGAIEVTIPVPAGILANSRFGGSSIHINDDYIFVGASDTAVGGTLYVYSKTGVLLETINNPNSVTTSSTDAFTGGYSSTSGEGIQTTITSGGGKLFIGTPNEQNSSLVRSGVLYIWDMNKARTFSDDVVFTGAVTIGTTTEKSSALTGATGVVAHDTTSNSLFVHSSVAADFTANFTNVPTTDDRTISVALIINQGATGYLPTAVQIDGVAQTILWQTATAPTATTSATDIASFTLIRSAGAWSVLGTVTAFGSV